MVRADGGGNPGIDATARARRCRSLLWSPRDVGRRSRRRLEEAVAIDPSGTSVSCWDIRPSRLAATTSSNKTATVPYQHRAELVHPSTARCADPPSRPPSPGWSAWRRWSRVHRLPGRGLSMIRSHGARSSEAVAGRMTSLILMDRIRSKADPKHATEPADAKGFPKNRSPAQDEEQIADSGAIRSRASDFDSKTVAGEFSGGHRSRERPCSKMSPRPQRIVGST